MRGIMVCKPEVADFIDSSGLFFAFAKIGSTSTKCWTRPANVFFLFFFVVLPRKDRIQEVADIERVAREVQLLKLIRPDMGCELQCSLGQC